MLDDLKTTKSALTKLHQDMEAINRLAKPYYLSVIEQMERTMEPIRRHQLEISRALDLSGAAPGIKEILDANQHLQDVIKQATASSRIVESLNATHQSWLDHLKLPIPTIVTADSTDRDRCTHRVPTGVVFLR